jgi:hypothetical protein
MLCLSSEPGRIRANGSGNRSRADLTNSVIGALGTGVGVVAVIAA